MELASIKPLHLALIVAASTIGGGLIMKVSQRAQPAPSAIVSQTQNPPATEPPVAEAAPTAEPDIPPAPATSRKHQREASKPVRVRQSAAIPPAAPVITAPSPTQTATAAPEVSPLPPARVEPEHVTPPPPPPAPPEPNRVTLNAGTLIPVRLVDGLSSERNMPGDTFTATLDKELVVNGFVIAERGARVEGRVVASDRGGRVKGVSTLEIEIIRLHTADGQKVLIQTDGFERRAEESRTQDAAKVGAGAAIGAVIGAIAGGGKGAAIGAGVGGGAGAGTVMATRGKPAALASETRLTFRLKSPVTITEKMRG